MDLTTASVDGHEGPLISDSGMAISQWIIFTFMCQVIDIFGTGTNIINIICFVKQGFTDPVNVSLLGYAILSMNCIGKRTLTVTINLDGILGLAVSDLGCLLPLIWTNICLTPAVIAADLPFNPAEIQYLTGAWPHVTFTRVSACITALITIERCLCVTAPLQVKLLVTTKRTTIAVICIFVVLIVSVAPMYVVNGFSFKFSPARNATILGLVFSENREEVESISYLINNSCVSFSAFCVITVCTIILVYKLNINTKWRSTSTGDTKAAKVSSRNTKAAKMVVMISTLFIVCFIPAVVMFVSMIFESNVSVTGKYRNVTFLLGGICFVLESVNSSMNILIYFYMSSKYRTAFHQLFSVNKSIRLIID